VDQPSQSPANVRVDRRGVHLFVCIAIVLLILDLGSKWILFTPESTRLHDGIIRDEASGRTIVLGSDRHEIRVIPHVLNLRLTVNEGAVFGLGQGKQVVFAGVSVFASGILIWMLLNSGRSRVEQLILGMLLAGVLGNFYDRVTYNYVRDMLYAFPGQTWESWFPFLQTSWSSHEIFPWIFNLADSYLVVGVALLLVRSVVLSRREAKALAPSAA
jgi:signal peptidase II